MNEQTTPTETTTPAPARAKRGKSKATAPAKTPRKAATRDPEISAIHAKAKAAADALRQARKDQDQAERKNTRSHKALAEIQEKRLKLLTQEDLNKLADTLKPMATPALPFPAATTQDAQ